MRRTRRAARVLTIFCVVLAAFFGLACALEDDGDLGVIPWPAEDASFSIDELSRALPGKDSPRLDQAASDRLHLSALGLRSAAPGGLCLLI